MMTMAQKDCCCCCNEARQTCLETLKYCLSKGGKYADAKFCMTLVECAQMCQICADCCAMESERCASMCKSCYDLCMYAARCCDAMGDKELSCCAEMLRKCAASCETMFSKMPKVVA